MQILRDIKSVPVLRPLMALMAGIIIGKSSGSFILYPFCIAMASFLLTFLIVWLKQDSMKHQRFLAGISVNLFFISTGILVLQASDKGIIRNSGETSKYWTGTILTEPTSAGNYLRYEMRLTNLSTNRGPFHVQALVDNSGKYPPGPGKKIICCTRLDKINGPENPGEFDYAGYLRNNGIIYRCFVRKGEWAILPGSEVLSLQILATNLRINLWEKIERSGDGNENLGVLYAIALGSKELLTREIRETYASTGAMHVLVVSGQHIAMLWMVLQYLFFWLGNSRGGNIARFAIICGLIWFYALMTGMTASVIRSAGMFSLVSLGKVIRKESTIYNSLCLSAFFGLFIHPRWIGDAGFQLSYFAVFGIVFFQPRIRAIWFPRTWIIRQVWEISSVSIAAQAGTLPLSLFYFHRFPPWFLISNVIVIPLVTLIMILFIIFLLFITVPVVFTILLKLLLFLIGIMNTSLRGLAELPSLGMEKIFFSDIQMIALFLVLAGTCLFIQYRRPAFLNFAVFFMTVLVSAGTIERFRNGRSEEIIVFSMKGNMAAGLICGRDALILHNCNDRMDFNPGFHYSCMPLLIEKGIKKIRIQSLREMDSLPSGIMRIEEGMNYYLRYNSKSVLIMDEPGMFKFKTCRNPLNADIIILNRSLPYIPPEHRDTFFQTSTLVLSSSLPAYYKRDDIRGEIILSREVIDVRESGAIRWFKE